MGNRVLEGVPFVVLIDARNFEKITKSEKKPFDEDISNLLIETTRKVATDLDNPIAYQTSDEASFLFRGDNKLFDRQVEKIISAVTSQFSVEMSIAAGKTITFMSRIIALPTIEVMIEYFFWRYDLGYRNALLQTRNHANLPKTDYSANYISPKIFQEMIMSLQEKNVDFFSLSNTFRRGAFFFWEKYTKEAFDPNKGHNISVERRKVAAVTDLPQHDQYDLFLKEKLNNIL